MTFLRYYKAAFLEKGSGLPVLQNGNFKPIKSSYWSLKAVLKTSRALSVPLSDEVPTPSNKEVFAAYAGVPGCLAQVATAGKARACGTAPGMPGEGSSASRRENQSCCGCSSSGWPSGIPHSRSVPASLCPAALSAPRSARRTVPAVILGTKLQRNAEGQPARLALPRAAQGLMSASRSPGP